MTLETEYKTKTLSRFICGAALGLACLASPARSQETGEMGVHELDAKVVSANRMEMPIQSVGSSVEFLDRYELQAGEQTFLLDALRSVPGLYLRNNGGPGGVFGITTRGLSSNRPTVLVNGIEVGNPADGEIINLGNLFSGTVANVEVLKGAQSSLYGADALAGVISINTMGTDQLSGGRASIGYGSYDTYDYSLGYTGTAGGFTWTADAQVHESEGFSAEDPAFGPAWADTDSYDNKAFSAAMQYATNEDTRWFLSALYFDAYSEYDPGNPAWQWSTPTGDNYSLTDRLFLRTGGDFRLSDSWTSTAGMSYSDVNTTSVSDGSGYQSDGDRYKIDWTNTVEVSEAWRFVAGVEHEIEDNRTDVGDRDNTSVFMENVLAASEKLDWTVGGRFDDNSAYGEEATFRSTFSYRIEDLDARVRGSFGTSFQAPNFYQLFNAFYGNADLKPETGHGWDLGFEKTFTEGKVFVSSTLFGNEVKDKIIWSGRYQNVDEYESIGLETSLRYYVSEDLRLTAAHTYSDAEENGAIEALRVPRNIVSLGLNWIGLDGKLNLNVDSLLVSSQYSDGSARANGQRQKGYEVVNLATSYQLTESQTLWLRVGNLFDTDYEEISGYQTGGANYQAGLRLRF